MRISRLDHNFFFFISKTFNRLLEKTISFVLGIKEINEAHHYY